MKGPKFLLECHLGWQWVRVRADFSSGLSGLDLLVQCLDVLVEFILDIRHVNNPNRVI